MKRKILTFVLFSLTATGCVVDVTSDLPVKPINEIRTFFGDGSNALVFTRDIDNTVGAAAVVDLVDYKVLSDGIGKGEFSSDLIVQRDNRNLYIIDRTNASITVIDPLDEYAQIKQISTGAGTNPRSVARIADKLYVSRYESAEVLVLDAKTFNEVGTVDLSKFASEADVYPEMGAAITAEGKVWLIVERWDRGPTIYDWVPTTAPTAGSYVISIDPATDKIVDEIKLLGVNPFAAKYDASRNEFLIASDNPLYVSGVETVQLSTAKSGGWLVEPGTFANGIYFIEPVNDSLFVVSGEDPDMDWNTDNDESVLWKVNRFTVEKAELARSSEGWFAMSCLEAVSGDRLVTCAGPGTRVAKPGLRVFDAKTGDELTTAPIATQLPPFGLALFARPETEVVSVPVSGATE